MAQLFSFHVHVYPKSIESNRFALLVVVAALLRVFVLAPLIAKIAERWVLLCATLTFQNSFFHFYYVNSRAPLKRNFPIFKNLRLLEIL